MIENLELVLEQDWIESESLMNWYRNSLKAGDVASVLERLKQDESAHRVTSEVVSLFTYHLKTREKPNY